MGIAGTVTFSDIASQIQKGYTAVIDNVHLRSIFNILCRDTVEKILAHELGHTLSLGHVQNLPERLMLGPGCPGEMLTDDEVVTIRTQAARHIPDRVIFPVPVPVPVPAPSPLGNTKVDALGDVPQTEAFIDLKLVGIGIDQQQVVSATLNQQPEETTVLTASTSGVFPDSISNLNYFFVADLDNDKTTGGSPSDIGIPTNAQGVELVGRVKVDVSNGVSQATPTVWKFQAGQFVETVDPSIQASVVPETVGWACLRDVPVCEAETYTVAETIQLELSSAVRGPMVTLFPLEAIAQNTNTGTLDNAPVEIILGPPTFPQCQVNPPGAVLGSTVTVTASDLLPNTTAEVFLGDQLVASGPIDNAGNASIDFAIPEDATTGVQPVVVATAGTAITADCVVNLVAIPAFDVPPSPPSGSAFTVILGDTLTFPIQASDGDVGDVVTLDVINLPTAASFPIPAPGNPAASTFSWTPTADQVGSHIIVFTATDNTGLSAPPHSIAINVIQPPPPPTPTPRPVIRPVGGYGEALGAFELLLPWLTLLSVIGVISVGVLLLRRHAV